MIKSDKCTEGNKPSAALKKVTFCCPGSKPWIINIDPLAHLPNFGVKKLVTGAIYYGYFCNSHEIQRWMRISGCIMGGRLLRVTQAEEAVAKTKLTHEQQSAVLYWLIIELQT